jgi:hypothetical protein
MLVRQTLYHLSHSASNGLLNSLKHPSDSEVLSCLHSSPEVKNKGRRESLLADRPAEAEE